MSNLELALTPLVNRIAIVGSGAVGATIAYAAMLQGLAHEIVLVDSWALKAKAEAMDLMHGSMFVPSVEVIAGVVQDCAGASVVVVTAGSKQKPGESRLDLVSSNIKIFRELIPKILDAAPQALLVIVSNPVDVLTHVCLKISGLPRRRVIGSGTVLDTSRFRSLLSKRLGVAVGNIHAYIVGEHGDSEVPLWSSAQIANIPLLSFETPACPLLTADERVEIFQNVRDAAAQVIAAKGATNWAIGLAVVRILESVFRDEHAVLTVSTLLEDYHGISDVCASVPCLVGSSGAGETLPLRYSVDEFQALQASTQVLRNIARQAGF